MIESENCNMKFTSLHKYTEMNLSGNLIQRFVYRTVDSPYHRPKFRDLSFELFPLDTKKEIRYNQIFKGIFYARLGLKGNELSGVKVKPAFLYYFASYLQETFPLIFFFIYI